MITVGFVKGWYPPFRDLYFDLSRLAHAHTHTRTHTQTQIHTIA